ncbi:MAG: DUF167 domain-containing protein [Patescibacteria group bacterium]|nr:DUF167 domain-containing protein [Patescibacteria group bacterium]
MKIKIKVHANSSQEKVKKIPENDIASSKVSQGKQLWGEVWIKQKPIDGEANKYLENFLKKYFKKEVKIIFGFNSKIKIVEII